jgi:hypothetical protein
MRSSLASNSATVGGSKPSSRNRASASSAKSSSRPVRKALPNDSLVKPSSCPLVMIEWEDSAQPIASWAYLASFEPSGTIRCASVGWLIVDGPDMKALAPNMGGDENSAQVSGVIQIPTRCVVKISRLREPTISS